MKLFVPRPYIEAVYRGQLSADLEIEMKADLTTSLTGPGGSKSVKWGVTVESKSKKVTKNQVR